LPLKNGGPPSFSPSPPASPAAANSSPHAAAPDEKVTISAATYDQLIARLTELREQALKEQPPSSPSDSCQNYRFHIRGTFARDGEHAVIITNGQQVWHIELRIIQFLTLLVLGSLARREAGLDAPIDVRGGEFLQPRRIALELARLKAREPDLQGQLEGLDLPPNAEDLDQDKLAAQLDRQPVYQAWHGLQTRFEENRVDHLLNGTRRSGYQIVVPPPRIKITLFDEDGSQTWG
jgi:hypothetical protein